MIIRTHKIKLNPTPTQERLLTQHAAYARAAYNWGPALLQGRQSRRTGTNARRAPPRTCSREMSGC